MNTRRESGVVSVSALAARLERVDVDMVALVAPAGFGKSTFAVRLIAQRSFGALCDAGHANPAGLARAVLDGLSVEDRSRAGVVAQVRAAQNASDANIWMDLAREFWGAAPPGPSTFVFDNLERALGDEVTIAFLGELLRTRPAARRVVLCSRSTIPRSLTRHALPHRVQRIAAADLRLQRDDILGLPNGDGLTEHAVEEVLRISQGWPLAVMLVLRLLAEGRGLDELADVRGGAYELLFEYLTDEYLNLLSPHELAVLIAAATLPNPTLEELAAIAGAELSECEVFVGSAPFLAGSTDRGVEVHPLVAAAIQERFRREKGDAVACAIEIACARENWVRAAEIAVAAGRKEEAAALLGRLPYESSVKRITQLSRIVSELDTELIVRNPAVWLSTIQCRRFSVRLEDYVAEARRVYYCLPPQADERLRTGLARQYASSLLHLGKISEAVQVIQDAIEATSDPPSAQLLRQHLAMSYAKLGKFRLARTEYVAATGSAESIRLRVLFLDDIEATSAIQGGEYERGMVLLEEALRTEREHGLISSHAITLANIAIEAFRHGDDERFERTVAELRANVPPGVERAWSFWLAAASGDVSAEPTGYEPVAIRANGYAFLSLFSGAHQVMAARQYYALAEANGDVIPRIYSRVALAELSPPDRPALLDSLQEIAREIELEPLRSAIQSYAAGGTVAGALGAFVARLRRGKARRATIALELTSGRLLRDGEPIRLSGKEMAVLVYLSLAGRPMHRDAICDAIWSEIDQEAAANNLKVVIHRIRKKLDEEAVILVRDGYCLGQHVSSNLRESEAFVRAAGKDGAALSAGDRERLQHLADAIKQRSSGDLLRWDWYATVDHRLNELWRGAVLAMARDVAAHHDYSLALAILGELFELDPSDEEASELVVRMHAAQNDPVAARREMKRFEVASARNGDAAAARRLSVLCESLFASGQLART